MYVLYMYVSTSLYVCVCVCVCVWYFSVCISLLIYMNAFCIHAYTCIYVHISVLLKRNLNSSYTSKTLLINRFVVTRVNNCELGKGEAEVDENKKHE